MKPIEEDRASRRVVQHTVAGARIPAYQLNRTPLAVFIGDICIRRRRRIVLSSTLAPTAHLIPPQCTGQSACAVQPPRLLSELHNRLQIAAVIYCLYSTWINSCQLALSCTPLSIAGFLTEILINKDDVMQSYTVKPLA